MHFDLEQTKNLVQNVQVQHLISHFKRAYFYVG